MITRAPLGIDNTARLIGFWTLSWVLLLTFVLLGMLAGLRSRREATAFLVPFVVWSVVAFVVPQIGTAARPVSLLNSVPAVATPGAGFDMAAMITRPLSVTEQFKQVAGQFLLDTSVSGDLHRHSHHTVDVCCPFAWCPRHATVCIPAWPSCITLGQSHVTSCFFCGGNRLFLVLLLFLIGAALLSVVVAAAAYRGDLEAYRALMCSNFGRVGAVWFLQLRNSLHYSSSAAPLNTLKFSALYSLSSSDTVSSPRRSIGILCLC